MANEVTFAQLHQKYCDLKDYSKKQGVSQQLKSYWDISLIRLNCDSIINDIETKMKTAESESDVWHRLLAMKGVILNFQVDFLLLFENFGLAMDILIENFKNIHPYSKSNYVSFVSLQTIHKIASICKMNDDLCSAQEILETAVDIYESSIDEGYCENEELFSPDETVWPRFNLACQFDNTYIFILEMLKIIHDSKKNYVGSVVLQHHILKIQLKRGDESLFIWLQNLLRLSNKLTHLQFYRCARHHLSVASYKLESLKKSFGGKQVENGKHVANLFDGLEANLALVWIKYALSMFVSSEKKYLEIYYIKKTQKSHSEGKDESQRTDMTLGKTDEKIEALKFQLDVSSIENLVTCEIIRTTNQAKDLFEFVIEWFNRAKEYYEFNEFPSEHISLMMDFSELHKSLAFFEPKSPERYILFQKRQSILNIIKNLSAQLDPIAFVDTNVEIMKELAQVHLDLLHSDLEMLKEIKTFAMDQLKNNPTKSQQLEKHIDSSIDLFENQLNVLETYDAESKPTFQF
ncbi:protein KBP homolog isoform X2 [Cimex lectularius]|uniref:KIF-binding protein n=1 Tax=Cimex lectularius TaxID=79782 RepID=A0A8I6RT70_CIMLE|nr:protein KBP homolog isoform X2 [Cimex lectularius]